MVWRMFVVAIVLCAEEKARLFLEPVFKPIDSLRPMNTYVIFNLTGGIYGTVSDQRRAMGDYKTICDF